MTPRDPTALRFDITGFFRIRCRDVQSRALEDEQEAIFDLHFSGEQLALFVPADRKIALGELLEIEMNGLATSHDPGLQIRRKKSELQNATLILGGG